VQQASIVPPVFWQVMPDDSHVYDPPLLEDPQAEPSNTQADNSTLKTTRENFMVRLTGQLVFCAKIARSKSISWSRELRQEQIRFLSPDAAFAAFRQRTRDTMI
jgi:hypothetical protein